MCTAQYFAWLRDPRVGTHKLHNINQRQDLHLTGPHQSLWVDNHGYTVKKTGKERKKGGCCNPAACVYFLQCMSCWSQYNKSITAKTIFWSWHCFLTLTWPIFFKTYFKMCEVWLASPVPWVSSGYLCVEIQSRCVKCGTFVLSDLIWQSWEKNSGDKTVLICADVDCPKGALLRTRFIDFPTEGNCGTRGHTSVPSHKYSPF